MSSASLYKWRAKYGGMDTSLKVRLKVREADAFTPKMTFVLERRDAEAT